MHDIPSDFYGETLEGVILAFIRPMMSFETLGKIGKNTAFHVVLRRPHPCDRRRQGMRQASAQRESEGISAM